jgi:hypothetical protein
MRDDPVRAVKMNPTIKVEYAFWTPRIFSEKATIRKMNIIAINERMMEKKRFRVASLKSITLTLIIA